LRDRFKIAISLLRHFPYTEYIFFYIPAYAIIIHLGAFNGLGDYLLVLPFIASGAYIFIYNDVCDRSKDVGRNPLGSLKAEKTAKALMHSFMFLAIVFLALSYKNPISYLLFIAHALLGLAYSGFGFRLKESFFGPAVAAFISHAGGPIILGVELGIGSGMYWAYVLAVFFYGFSREIAHTVLDYESDWVTGVKTYAIRSGFYLSTLSKYLIFCLAAVLFSSVFSSPKIATTLFAFILIPSLVLELIIDLKRPSYLEMFRRSPYVLMKYYLVFVSCVLLNLPMHVIALVIWLYGSVQRG
jgi:4-hydroxybenzoate polyprenyltransferase